MTRKFAVILSLILSVAIRIHDSQSWAAEINLNGHTFTLPEGFSIELVAGSPLVDRPITADFDEQERLYVADSSGSNDRPDKQLIDRTHRIVRLEDVDGDGRFDKSVVFADKMMFPEGTLWHAGSLYVSAPPSIWKLTDTDGDGVADERVEWFDGKTLTGCANDLHGPYLGPDGWIYWCKGAFAEQTYPLPDRKTKSATNSTSEPRQLVTRAAHIFRRRADGTGLIESVMTGGMDNPVDVVFLQGGERIFTTTFLQNPGGGLRDGLIHAVHGAVYGKVHHVTDYHPRTGDLMPPLVHMGPAAPCGLTRYESRVFGDDYQDNIFACQFNMHKVSRHALQRAGATFDSQNSDFVVSSNLDFHPTDVLEDADGSLVICDTGGWYTLCCPTSQLTKPDILGGVYRVRSTRSKSLTDGRGLKLDWKSPTPAELVRRLTDPRPAVRTRSIAALASLGDSVIPIVAKALRDGRDPFLRRNLVWTLGRLNQPSANAAVREALLDQDLNVRLAALHLISLWRDQEAFPTLVKLLRDPSDAVVRAAAEALGRIENSAAVPELLRAANRAVMDRVLEHSLTYALIELEQPIDLAIIPVSDRKPMLERIVMIANDQMSGGHADPQTAVRWLKSPEPTLKQTAQWLVSRHPDWGQELASYLQEQLASDERTESDRIELVRQLAQFCSNPAIEGLLASAILHTNGRPESSRRAALEAMRESSLKELPESWIAPLTQVINEGDLAFAPLAIAVVRRIPIKQAPPELTEALLRFSSNTQAPVANQVEALAAIPGGIPHPTDAQLSLLVSNLTEEASVSTRSAAVDALTRTLLDAAALTRLSQVIPQVGPLELNRLLAAFENCADASVGTALVAGLKQSPVLTSLRVDSVKQRLAKFPSDVQSKAEELYAAINVEAGRQQERLNEFMNSLEQGDIRRGQLVFNSQKAACSACHAMGYLGGTIGPDLSRIGKIRTERDLLESVMFPSVSFVRSYEPVLIVTKSGQQVNGLIRRETPEEITLATGAREEARILRAEIDEIRPSSVSVMPAGLDTQLTRQQIADLIAFLKAKQ